MRILIPLDGTPECEAAVPLAAKLTAATQAELYLLRVLEGFAATETHVHHEPEWPHGIEGEVLAMMKKARTYMDGLVSRFELPARTRCLVGRSEEPADEICSIAEANQIDLIVMASHCRRGLQRLTQGSVCDEVIRRRACPVLVVPQRAEQSVRGRLRLLKAA